MENHSIQIEKENKPAENDKQPTDIMQKLLSSNLFKEEEASSSEETRIQEEDPGLEGGWCG